MKLSTIKKKMRDKINSQNLSLTDLAKESGLKRSSISNILLDRVKKPNYSMIRAIASVFECTPEELIGVGEEEYNAINARDPEIDPLKQITWNAELYLNSVTAFYQFCSNEAKSPENLAKAQELINEIYNFHLQKQESNNKIDQDFVKWIANRSLL